MALEIVGVTCKALVEGAMVLDSCDELDIEVGELIGREGTMLGARDGGDALTIDHNGCAGDLPR